MKNKLKRLVRNSGTSKSRVADGRGKPENAGKVRKLIQWSVKLWKIQGEFHQYIVGVRELLHETMPRERTTLILFMLCYGESKK